MGKENMAKEIYKHTFYVDQVSVVDGELIIGDPVEYTYNFSLVMKGMDLFEKEYGKPLISTLTNIVRETNVKTVEELENLDDNMDFLLGMSSSFIDGKFIKALACASYIKIENNQPINNEFTAEEFKQLPVYPYVTSDFEFLGKMLSMAVSCIQDDNPKKKQNQKKVKN